MDNLQWARCTLKKKKLSIHLFLFTFTADAHTTTTTDNRWKATMEINIVSDSV